MVSPFQREGKIALVFCVKVINGKAGLVSVNLKGN
jgi:hypothetical protein